MRLSIYRAVSVIAVVSAFLTTAALAQPVVKWNPSEPLNSYWNEDNGGDEMFPELASDGNGNFAALWAGATGVFSAFSSDGGATWGEQHKIATDANARTVAMSYGGNGVWVAQWRSRPPGSFPPIPQSHYVSRSSDAAAATWSSPQRISNYHYPVNLNGASDGAGTLITMEGPDYFLRSTDSGNTWTTVTLTGVPPAYFDRWQVASGGNGTWYAAASGSDPTNNSIAILYGSVDNGVTWSATDVSNHVGDVMDMAARGNQVAITNWPDVYASSDGGITWSGYGSHYVAKIDQSIAVDNAGNWIVVATPKQNSNSAPRLAAKTASNPAGPWSAPQFLTSSQDLSQEAAVVAAGSNGNFVAAGHVNAVATTRPGPDFDIASFKTSNGGTTWNPLVYLNDGALDDFPYIMDTNVQLVSGDNGAVVAAWLARAGRAGLSTYRIMFARSSDYGKTWTNTAPIIADFGRYAQPFDSFELRYAGQNRWLISWTPGEQAYWGSYSISNDNGFTWSAAATYFGELAAGSGAGTLVKTHSAASGSTVNYFMARMPREAAYFEEPVAIAERPRAICHTSGANWFVITEPNNVFTSTDDGRTWNPAFTAANVPPPWSKLAVDSQGSVAALYYETPQPGNRTPMIRVSQDNGVTWGAATTLDSFDPAPPHSDPFNLFPWSAWGDLASPAPGQWLAVWRRPLDPPAVHQYAISRNGGTSWTGPLPVSPAGVADQSALRYDPSLAADNGKAVLGWNAGEDIYYNYALTSFQTAAKDWQLFD